MKRFLSSIVLTLVAAVSYASDVVCVGTATQVVKGGDTTFVFRDEIRLKSVENNIPVPIDWYYADGSIYASNTDEIFPDEGCYKANGHSFCVELYQGIDDLAFTIEPDCESTILHVTGDVLSRAHTYSLSYNALAWNTEEWVDSAATMSGDLKKNILMPALYGTTPIKLCYDTEIREALGLDSACVEEVLLPDNVRAVKLELTSLATSRGKEGEKSNELNRPTSQTLITGSTYSGPLEVAFYSNPTPAANFYAWTINGSELITTRQDKDIRYTFYAEGNYRVICKVNNQYCITDSTEVTISIGDSYLKVPNFFSPNGDGKNDEFRVAYRSIKEFHCWVYNRWGKLVFEWTDPSKGWDGTINGRPAAEGAYFYVVRALGTDAVKNAGYMSKISYQKAVDIKSIIQSGHSPNGIYQLSGDINLIRGK